MRSVLLEASSVGWIFACLTLGCSDDLVDVAEPVSQACLQCLSERESKGCAAEYSACEEIAACDDYVVCQLTGHCFERPSGSGCEQELECKRPSAEPPSATGDAGDEVPPSPRELANAFEDCARSTCRTTCGFVE